MSWVKTGPPAGKITITYIRERETKGREMTKTLSKEKFGRRDFQKKRGQDGKLKLM